MKTRYIFNPIANLGKARAIEPAMRALANEICAGEWCVTTRPGHATQLARQASADGFERVVALGGDGTMHEVVNGLMQTEKGRPPQLGAVPIGSGNDFAFALGMPIDPAAALRQIHAGAPHQIDLSLLELGDGRQVYSANSVGLGFDTIVTIRSRKVPVLHGFAVYFIAVLQTILLNHHPFQLQVTCDGKTWDGKYIMVVMCNGRREGGGFLVTPDGRQDDQILDYVTVSDLSRLQMIGLIPKFINGTHKGHPNIALGRFQEMRVKSNRGLQVHVDGEVVLGLQSTVSELLVRVLPGALTVIR